MSKHTFYQLNILLAMLIWSTIGMVRRFIDFPSGLIAVVRGATGVLFLVAVVLCLSKPFNWQGIKQNWGKLLLAGCFLGTNWAILFEAYQHTSVAAAELFYYTNPLFVILLNPLLMGERITFRQLVCVLLALAGMVLVSGLYTLNVHLEDGWGILLAVTAAAEVAGLIFVNKHIENIGTYERAIVQLAAATLVLVPYVFFTENVFSIDFSDSRAWLLTCLVGLVHTGIAYYLYYNGIANLKAQEICILGYTDPFMAIVWSSVVFGETLGTVQIVGAVLILGSMMYAELRG
ncbi:MAG: EamA family transporter [Phascolarctobacterium sp.]|nr:EamA family transporter [Phascolarctobacterium sp.]